MSSIFRSAKDLQPVEYSMDQILSMLSGDEMQQGAAARSLVTWTSENRGIEKFIHNGGLGKLIPLISTPNPTISVHSLVALCNMTSNEFILTKLIEAGGPKVILMAAQSSPDPVCRVESMRALSNIVNFPAGRASLSIPNVIQTACESLAIPVPALKIQAAAVLANLSVDADSHKAVAISALLPILRVILIERDARARWLLTLTLTNLAYTDFTKQMVLRDGGMELFTVLARDPAREVRQQATKALALYDGHDIKITDHFGFVQQSSLTSFGRHADAVHDTKKEIRHEKKWVAMLKSWEDYQSGSDQKKLKDRIKKGIPEKLRCSVWMRLRSIRVNREVLEQYKRLLLGQSDMEEIISKDVNRALTSNTLFRPASTANTTNVDELSPSQKALYNVLKAYSIKDRELGYCQGMSVIAAVLLLYFPEEQTFCIFDSLMNGEHALRPMYMPGFPLLHEYLYIYEQLAIKHLPNVYAHLTTEGVLPIMYAEKWFMTLLQYSYPFPIALRVWDLYMYYGPKALFKVAIATLKFFKKDLLSMKFEKIMGFLQSGMKQRLYDTDRFIRKVLKIKIKSKEVEHLRSTFRATLARPSVVLNGSSTGLGVLGAVAPPPTATTITSILLNPKKATDGSGKLKGKKGGKNADSKKHGSSKMGGGNLHTHDEDDGEPDHHDDTSGNNSHNNNDSEENQSNANANENGQDTTTGSNDHAHESSESHSHHHHHHHHDHHQAAQHNDHGSTYEPTPDFSSENPATTDPASAYL
eukprot:TRINITY_DN2604_c0_g2::TRINITY_DN2604_c0_g2_i1::g.25887::m.25887 TRINITY_DN2604_c0_g2::TRINITY_DN2604_c0_g2_i1::g.25887  ORF type:complete len:757 (-),score=216.64,sp/Q80XC3/US6NL_MOUSE/29.26/9e-46,RabGAP-TBC/PF00566.13/7.2e-47,Arm/PF00514.18/0.023,Arm/PF00514.18/49,Arm/PF00514.18/2.4e+02,Arm/PF00514.18/10,HEAT_2/PF13646.1/1.7,HEAT_2/PF13646.1/6.8,Arm_2/PF04826.8/54,Arm_2/PF04826.8/2.4,Arm_2/PF04826.8/1.9e+02,Zip/PF02535.17/0.086,HEAT_EZ/PF13513.1/1.1e+03,HEAT_EZ/PF13513.1/5.4e+02,HEAT_EZ/PF13513